MDNSMGAGTRYVMPGLGGVYAALDRFSWPLVRAATGLFFVPHGMQKLFGFWGGGLAKYAAGFAKNGLPLSLQLVGKPFDEATLYRAAAVYEAATGWIGRHPRDA